MSLLQGCSHLWQGQGVTKGFSSLSWCSCAVPFLQSHGASSGNAARSSAGTEPRWMETDDHFCKQWFTTPKNKPTTYFTLISRGGGEQETSMLCDSHHHEHSASVSPTCLHSACLPFQPVTSRGQELSLTGCLCRSEHNGALILVGSFWCSCNTADGDVLDWDCCWLQLMRYWKCLGGQGGCGTSCDLGNIKEWSN